MSFRLYLYYCGVAGAWFALLGWGLGRLLAPGSPDDTGAFLRTILRALSLGTLVALGLGVVDALGSTSRPNLSSIAGRAGFVAALGCLGGLFGGALGQTLYASSGMDLLIPIGWMLTGMFIGASIGTYDVVVRLQKGESVAGALRKVIHGLLGGALGGVLGGLVSIGLGAVLSRVVGRPAQDLVSTSAWGFVALGALIGLFIGLAQVILKEAWVRVEVGFRPGRELILTKEQTLLGRAEGCDVGLYNDPDVSRQHARIIRRGRRYLLESNDKESATFLNDQRVTEPTYLQSGDIIRLGASLLRFGERQTSQPSQPAGDP